MTDRPPRCAMTLVFVAVLSGLASAHHGSAVSYDTDVNKLITMKGTVKA